MYLQDFIMFFSPGTKKLRKNLEMYLQDFIMFFFLHVQQRLRKTFEMCLQDFIMFFFFQVTFVTEIKIKYSLVVKNTYYYNVTNSKGR